MSATLGIVTATTNRERAEPCLQSWVLNASGVPEMTVVVNGAPYVGAVAAFAEGVEMHMRKNGDEIVACLHDDLVILESGWDRQVLDYFAAHPKVGLVGVGGWTALGSDDLYEEPYDPTGLAGHGFTSAFTDAERHGARVTEPKAVVALSDIALIGRRAFWSGFGEEEWRTRLSRRKVMPRPWAVLKTAGLVQHFVGAALGCVARRLGWQVVVLPLRCRHLGDGTRREPAYHQWAAAQIDGGDRGFWDASRRITYDTFRDVLPLRL